LPINKFKVELPELSLICSALLFIDFEKVLYEISLAMIHLFFGQKRVNLNSNSV